jgi:hypothetical protein
MHGIVHGGWVRYHLGVRYHLVCPANVIGLSGTCCAQSSLGRESMVISIKYQILRVLCFLSRKKRTKYQQSLSEALANTNTKAARAVLDSNFIMLAYPPISPIPRHGIADELEHLAESRIPAGYVHVPHVHDNVYVPHVNVHGNEYLAKVCSLSCIFSLELAKISSANGKPLSPLSHVLCQFTTDVI